MNENLSKEQQMGMSMKKSDKDYMPPLQSADVDDIDKGRYISDIQYFTYKLRNVHRLATVPLHKPYSVAEHCYFTGLIYIDLCRKRNVLTGTENIEWVFRHDLVEAVTGDLIYPVKHHNGFTEEAWHTIEAELSGDNNIGAYMDGHAKERFSDEEWRIFKCADLYELFLFCASEYDLGNRHIGLLKVIHNCLTYIPDFKINKVNGALLTWAEENKWMSK